GSAAGGAARSPEDARPASPSFSLHHALRSFQKKLISIAATRARASESSTRAFSSSSRSSSNESWLKRRDCTARTQEEAYRYGFSMTIGPRHTTGFIFRK